MSPSPLAPPASVADLQAITPALWQDALQQPAPQAAAWMAAAAQLGHVPAQAALGQWLLDGRGLPRDERRALRWFVRAARQGDAMAMNMAGRCHEQGWGTPADAARAAHWYRQAAVLDLPQARYNLANLLAAGSGVPQDHGQAVALYRRAADQGYAKAFAKLGRYHEDGLVVPRDAAQALRCYQLGAQGGDFRSQFNYAGMLAALGRRDEALQWLAKVPASATPGYLRQAGALLLQSPDAAFSAIGQRMLTQADG